MQGSFFSFCAPNEASEEYLTRQLERRVDELADRGAEIKSIQYIGSDEGNGVTKHKFFTTWMPADPSFSGSILIAG